MPKKDQEKLKVEIIKLTDIKSLELSEKTDFIKKGQYALELIFNGSLYYLISYDVYQLKEW
jgi:hypothetical protein